jgi:hypothetical protein
VAVVAVVCKPQTLVTQELVLVVEVAVSVQMFRVNLQVEVLLLKLQ